MNKKNPYKDPVSKWETEVITQRIERSGGYEYLKALIDEADKRKNGTLKKSK
jgi:hypothetical protein